MVTALVFRYVTNHHKLSGFTQHLTQYFCSQFCKSVVWSDMTGFSAPCLPELKCRYWLGLCFHLEFQGFHKLTGLWQNADPDGCGTEVPVSLLVVSQRLLSASTGHTRSLSCGPLCLQNQQGRISCASAPSCTLNLCPLPSLTSTPLTFRAHRIKSGPPGKSPYLKVSCFGTLISFAKSRHSNTWISI